MSHPIRLPEVHAAIEVFTARALAASNGTGKILVEFDFKEWRAMSFRPLCEGARTVLDKVDVLGGPSSRRSPVPAGDPEEPRAPHQAPGLSAFRGQTR